MDPTLPSPPSLLALFLPINPFLLPSPFSSLAKLSNYSLSSSRPPSFFPPFLPVSCLFNYVSLSVGPAALFCSQILLMEANLAALSTSHHHKSVSVFAIPLLDQYPLLSRRPMGPQLNWRRRGKPKRGRAHLVLMAAPTVGEAPMAPLAALPRMSPLHCGVDCFRMPPWKVNLWNELTVKHIC